MGFNDYRLVCLKEKTKKARHCEEALRRSNLYPKTKRAVIDKKYRSDSTFQIASSLLLASPKYAPRNDVLFWV
jgi:hypothetical protein